MEITGQQTDLAPRIQWLERTSSHETKYTSSDDFFTEHAVRVYARARSRVRVYFAENVVYTRKDEFFTCSVWKSPCTCTCILLQHAEYTHEDWFFHVQCLIESLYIHMYTFTESCVHARGWIYHLHCLKQSVSMHIYFLKMVYTQDGNVWKSPWTFEEFYMRAKYSRAMSDSNIFIYAAFKKSQGKFSLKTLLLFSLNRFSSADVV